MVTAHEADVQKLQKELSVAISSASHSDGTEGEVSILKAQLSAVESQKIELEQSLEAAKQDIVKWEAQYSTLAQNEYIHLEKTQQLTDDINQRKIQLSEAVEERDHFATLNANHKEEIQTLRAEIEIKTLDCENYVQELSDLRSESASCSEQLSSLQLKLNSAIQDCSAATQDKDAEIVKRNKIVDDLNKVIVERDEALAKVKRVVTRNKELKELKVGGSAVAETEAEVNKLRKDIESKNERIQELEYQVEELERRVNELELSNANAQESHSLQMAELRKALDDRSESELVMQAYLKESQDSLAAALSKSDVLPLTVEQKTDDPDVKLHVSELVGALEVKHRAAMCERDAAVDQAKNASKRIKALSQLQEDYEQLQGQLNSSNTKIGAMQSEHYDITQELISLRSEKQAVEMKFSQMQVTHDEVREHLLVSETNLAALTNELAAERERVEAVTKERDTAKEKAKQAAKRAKELKASAGEQASEKEAAQEGLREDLRLCQEAVVEKETALAALRIEVEALTSKACESQASLTQLEATHADTLGQMAASDALLNEARSQHAAKLESLETENASREQAITDLTNELAAERERVEAVTKERDTAKEKAKQAAKRAKELKASAGEQASEKEAAQEGLREDLRLCQEAVVEKETALAALRIEVEALTSKACESQASLTQLEATHADTLGQMAASDALLNEARSQHAAKLESLETENASREQAITDLTNELAAERERVEAVTKERDTAKEKAKQAAKRAKELKASAGEQASEKEAAQEGLREDLRLCQEAVVEKETALAALRIEVEALTSKACESQASLTQLEATHADTLGQMAASDALLNEARSQHAAKLESLETENASREQAITDLTNELAAERERVEAVTKERDTAKEKAKQAAKRAKELKASAGEQASEKEAAQEGLREDLRLCQEAVVEKETALAALRIEVEALTSKACESQASLTQLEATHADTLGQMAASDALLNEARSQHAAKLESLETENASREQAITDLTNELAAERERVEAVTKERDTAKEKAKQAAKRAKELKASAGEQASEKEAAQEGLREDLRLCQEAVVEKETALAALRIEVNERTSSSANKDATLADQTSIIAELKQSIANMNAEIASERKQASEVLDSRLAEFNVEKEKEKGKMTKLITKLREMKVSLDGKAEEAKLLSVENDKLQSQLTEALQGKTDSDERGSSATSKLFKLNAKLDSKVAEVERLQATEQELKAEINKIRDNKNVLESVCESQRGEIKSLLAELKQSTDIVSRFQAREARPVDFDVKLRCEDDDNNVWCLVDTRVRTPINMSEDSSNPTLVDETRQWHLEEKVLQWISEKDVAAEGGFSIEEEIELPPTIQDSLLDGFAEEKNALLDKIASITSELDNSHKSFDAYRERTRTSLKVSASTQKAADDTIASLKKELKFQQVRQQQTEAAADQRVEHFISALHEVRHLVQAEKTQLSTLQHRLAESQSALMRLQEEYEENLAAMKVESEAAKSAQETFVPLGDVQAIQGELSDMKESFYALKQKEAKLLQEIKKRGDLARQLCSEKDEEIKNLREKLHYDQKQIANGGDGGKSPIKNGLERRHSKDHAETNDMCLASTSSDHNAKEEGQIIATSSSVDGKTFDEKDLEFSSAEDDENGDFQILLNIARFQAQRDIKSGDPAVHFQQSLQRLVENNQSLRAEIERLQERENRRLDMNMSGYSSVPRTVKESSQESNSAKLSNSTNDTDSIEEAREQRLSYLRNAFSKFVQAKDAVEVQNIGRVICTILNFSNEEQVLVNAAITRFSPAIVASSTIDNLSSTVSSFFNF